MDEQIIRILIEAGDKGIRIDRLCLHVFNACNGLFDTVSKEEVRRHVYGYVRQRSRKPGTLLERVKRGVYRINTQSKAYRSLLDKMKRTEDTEPGTSTSQLTEWEPTLF